MDRVELVSFEGEVLTTSSKLLNVSEVLAEVPSPEERIHLDFLEIDTRTLSLVIKYLEHYDFEPPKYLCQLETSELSDSLENHWDFEFMQEISPEETIKLALACQKLDIKGLKDLVLLDIASFFKGEDMDELTGVPNLKEKINQLEEFLRQENSWAFEDQVSLKL